MSTVEVVDSYEGSVHMLQGSVANHALSGTLMVIGGEPAFTIGKKAAVGLVMVYISLPGNVLEVYW